MSGSGGDSTAATSLYELFFDLEDNLCCRYRGLTPFQVRREKVGEVFLLVKRINQKNLRENGIGKKDQVIRYRNGDVHIRRKATRDDWY